MSQNCFVILFWGLIMAVGGGSVHLAASKMRSLALEKVARPWPSLKYEMKQNFDRDPFIIVKKNGHTYLVHKDRLKKKESERFK